MAEMKNDTEKAQSSMKPMTADALHAYLRDVADRCEIENRKLTINGHPVVEVVLRNKKIVGQFSTSNDIYVELISDNKKRDPITAAQLDEFLEEFSEEIVGLRVMADLYELGNVSIESGSVVLHQMPSPPTPMTGEILKGYLESIISDYPVANELVLIGKPADHIVDRCINDYRLRNGIIVLDNEKNPTRMALTAVNLMRYLAMTSGGILNRAYDRPVMIGDQEISNACVVDNRVVLQTFQDMLDADQIDGI